MAIEIFEGYETNQLPTIEQRILDATRICEMGYEAILGVAINPDNNLHRVINAEIKISTTRPKEGDYIIGPFVLDKEGEPFVPYGLCLWKNNSHGYVIT